MTTVLNMNSDSSDDFAESSEDHGVVSKTELVIGFEKILFERSKKLRLFMKEAEEIKPLAVPVVVVVVVVVSTFVVALAFAIIIDFVRVDDDCRALCTFSFSWSSSLLLLLLFEVKIMFEEL